MPSKGTAKEVTIIGTVRALEWDEDNNVVGVYILGEEDEEYVVQPNDKGTELLDYVGLDVSVTGLAREVDGERWLVVKRFSQLILDDLFEDPEDERVPRDEF
jgi:hypothetical protein